MTKEEFLALPPDRQAEVTAELIEGVHRIRAWLVAVGPVITQTFQALAAAAQPLMAQLERLDGPVGSDHCLHWQEGDGDCCRCGMPNWCPDEGATEEAHAIYERDKRCPTRTKATSDGQT